MKKKAGPLLFLSKEKSSLSAEALSEADGKRYRMSHYVELEKYNRELEEYNQKMLKYQAGDKGAFEEKLDPLLFFSKEETSLSAKALSEADGKRYRQSYYDELRQYQIEREEYERKLLLYHSGEKNIFEKKEKERVLLEGYSLTAEALSYIDGKKYKMSYYRDLEKYNRELQDYNRKLALHNAGHEDAFSEKADPFIFYTKERSSLSTRALSLSDGKKYKMSYYKKLKNYYEELEEYEIKKLLYQTGQEENPFGDKKVLLAQSDIVENNFSMKNLSDKIWTPRFKDMIAAINGRFAPYFMDNLLSAMRKVDGEFERKFTTPAIRVYMDCSTEIIPEDELFEVIKKTGQ